MEFRSFYKCKIFVLVNTASTFYMTQEQLKSFGELAIDLDDHLLFPTRLEMTLILPHAAQLGIFKTGKTVMLHLHAVPV